MKKLLTALLTLAMAFTMVFATAASAEDARIPPSMAATCCAAR